MEKYGVTEEDISGTEWSSKKIIREKINIRFRNNLTKDNENKSKLGYFLEGRGEWKAETPAQYMNQLTRKQASTIFKTRTRMIKVKANYKNGHKNLRCRACGDKSGMIKWTETQMHCLEVCAGLHQEDNTRIRKENIFSDDIETLRNSAKGIDNLMGQLEG